MTLIKTLLLRHVRPLSAGRFFRQIETLTGNVPIGNATNENREVPRKYVVQEPTHILDPFIEDQPPHIAKPIIQPEPTFKMWVHFVDKRPQAGRYTWEFPAHKIKKANVNASFWRSNGVGYAAIGCVYRDDKGNWLGGFINNVTGVNNSIEAAMVGIRTVLLKAVKEGDELLVVENDCLHCIQRITCINYKSYYYNDNEFMNKVILECQKIFMEHMYGWAIRHVRKAGNKVAHNLANYGRRKGAGVSVKWEKESCVPESVISLIANESKAS